MSWRLAKSLETLRAQINAAYPNRSKVSDGTIGDAAHVSRASDHNPNADGVVTALDITHDPSNGVDIQNLADSLVASKDARIKYIICNGRIVSGSGQKNPAWQWRTYTGANKHTKHVHISVKGTRDMYDSVAQWSVAGTVGGKVTPSQSVLKKGSKGPFVAELQRNLNTIGFGPLKEDGDFGEKTEKAVKAFQNKVGLTSDGWAGPRTLEAIGMAIGALNAKPKIEKLEAVAPAVEEEVKKSTGALGWLTGIFTGSSVGIGAFMQAEWSTIIAIAAVGLVAVVGVLVFRRKVVNAVKEIRDGLSS